MTSKRCERSAHDHETPPLVWKKARHYHQCRRPTTTNPEDVKDKFYDELHSFIATVPRADKLIILGDINARVVSDNISWDGVIGKYGVGRCNNNGLLLLQTYAEHDLLITNTVHRLPTRNRTSQRHTRSKHWQLIDYVIVRKRDRQAVISERSVGM